MFDKVVILLASVFTLINNIFDYFKKSPAEEREKILDNNKKSEEKFSETGRPE